MHVTVPDPRTVSRWFRATLTAPAAGSVEFHRGRSLLAGGPFSAPAGPLRLRLKTTDAGRRALRRDPDPKLFVTVATRTGGDTRMEDDDGGELIVIGGDVTPGAGCEGVEVSCSLAGVTTVRVFLGDRNDRFEVRALVAIVADLGPGDDEFEANGLSAAVSGGPGADYIDGFNAEQATGPFQLDGGPGNDTLIFAGRVPGITLTGGAGDDVLALALSGPTGPPIDFVSGPGADRAIREPQDRAGDGCARPVTGLTDPKRVSRTFREGRLATPARGGVTLRRRTTTGGLDLAVIARRDFSAPAGPLRVRLRTTADGRRWLRRNPKLPVWVSIRTRTGSDRAEVIFESRLG